LTQLVDLRKTQTPVKVRFRQLRKETLVKKPSDLVPSKAAFQRIRKRSEVRIDSLSGSEVLHRRPSLNSTDYFPPNLSYTIDTVNSSQKPGSRVHQDQSKLQELGKPKDLSRVQDYVKVQEHARVLEHSNLRKQLDAVDLENQLTIRLAAVKSKEAICDKKFKVYQKIFEEIISKDEQFGSLLLKIKTAYEDWQRVEGLTLTERYRSELKTKEEEALLLQQDFSLLGRKVAKLAKENVGLSRALDETDAMYSDLQKQLLKLSKVKIGDLPQDESSWQYLVSENKYYVEVIGSLKKDLKYMTRREDKLLRLINAIKLKGYPVEDIYDKECRSSANKPDLPYKEEPGNAAFDDEEVEPIVQGPPKAVRRPKVVPPLSFTEVEPDISSPSDSHSGYSDSMSSCLAQSNSICKLSSSTREARPQEDNLLCFSEFSESWRRHMANKKPTEGSGCTFHL
jgi:hypothetical protein